MKPLHYAVLGFAVLALVLFIYSNNRDEGSEIAGRGDDTSQDVSSGALDGALYTLNPQAAIELLLEQSALPEEAVPGLTEAQRLYAEAVAAPASVAIPLLEQSVDQLSETAALVEGLAQDASNQVSADNLRRLSTSILVIRDRVQDDLELLEETGTPVSQIVHERFAA